MTGEIRIFSGARVVLPGGVQSIDITVRDGRIIGLGETVPRSEAVERIDLAGLTILPGAVDPHLHLGHGKDISRPRVPEDAAQETAAAAVGGVTTFIPYLMATEPFETLFDDVDAVTERGEPHRFRLSLHYFDRSAARRSP